MKPKNVKSSTKKSGRGGKGASGVKNTLVKAKVNAVKTSRKLKTPRNRRDEVADLLEQTANDSKLNGSYVGNISNGRTPRNRKAKDAVVTKRLRKLKSQNSLGTLGKKKNDKTTNGVTNGQTNGSHHDQIEVAQEAKEISTVDGPSRTGFLKKTMSKIWRIPENISGAVPYDGMAEENHETTKKIEDNKPATPASSGCIIS